MNEKETTGSLFEFNQAERIRFVCEQKNIKHEKFIPLEYRPVPINSEDIIKERLALLEDESK